MLLVQPFALRTPARNTMKADMPNETTNLMRSSLRRNRRNFQIVGDPQR
jgi:hypothetical protein